jgi:hypothetical protein
VASTGKAAAPLATRELELIDAWWRAANINEGGELGYSLLHAYGAAFDKPDLLVACVIGDGEAETGPLAASWHSNKFLNARRDGAVLPILHLNGDKIANPTVLARIPTSELRSLLEGYAYAPRFGHDDDALRHGDAQRPRPLPPRDGRDRPCRGPRRALRSAAPGNGGRTPALSRLHARARRRSRRDPRLDLAESH